MIVGVGVLRNDVCGVVCVLVGVGVVAGAASVVVELLSSCVVCADAIGSGVFVVDVVGVVVVLMVVWMVLLLVCA